MSAWKTYVLMAGAGFVGALVCILSYQAYLDHERIKAHGAAIQGIVQFIKSQK